MLSGDNSLIKRAGASKEETIIGQEKDYVGLAYSSASTKKLGTDITEEDLQTELNASVGNDKTTVTRNYNNTFKILFKDTQHIYTVNGGQVAKIDVDDTNDGFYIGEKRILFKLYVPTDDCIISDILCKSGVSSNTGLQYHDNLAKLALATKNSDYLNVLNDLGYINQDYAYFVKTCFLNNLTSNDENTILYNKCAPMFVIQKTSDNKYKLLLEWNYQFGRQGALLYKNQALITSDITFLNDDFTEYELGNLKVENSAYECNTTKEPPFGDDLSTYTNANNELENFSIVYNSQKYEGMSGLKQFLDNVLGFKNTENASRYADLGTYVNTALNGTDNTEEIQRLEAKYSAPLAPVKNTNIVTNYINTHNNFDGIYVNGEKIIATGKIETNTSKENENNLLGASYSSVFRLWNSGYISDFKLFEYFLNKQLIDPSVVNAILKTYNIKKDLFTEIINEMIALYPYPDVINYYQNIDIQKSNYSIRARNLQPNPTPNVKKISETSYTLSIPFTYDLTVSFPFFGEILNLDLNLNLKLPITIGANDEVVFSDVYLPYHNWIAFTVFHSREDFYSKFFKWNDFRDTGFSCFMSENILPYPDKQEFWTKANEQASKDEIVNNKLSTYNNNNTKENEIFLYEAVYNSIVREAIESGNYELRQNGKTYTGKNALKDFLIENYGLDNASKLREMASNN